MKSSSTSRKRWGSSTCGKWPASSKTSSRLRGHQLVRRQAVLDRDDRVALAPDEQERDVLGEVEAVAGVHPLAARVHDRAQRVHERRRAPRGPPARRGRGPARPCRCRRGARAARGSGPRRGPASSRRVLASSGSTISESGSVAARSRRFTLAAEAAAVHEHEPLAALGELVGELHHDAAAERVPDERRALVAERDHQVADAARVGARASSRRAAWPTRRARSGPARSR